jgi:LPXTG-site transpeptidase (sortase) family protein
MIRGHNIDFKKVRFYNSVVVLNAATLFLLIFLFQPFGLLRKTSPVFAYASVTPVTVEAITPAKAPISGKPTRIEIIQTDNGMHIDLPVKEGFYDATRETWTLNQLDAFFAMPSMPANDTRGTSMIYGHNEAEVFSHMSALRQNAGAYALVHTDAGKIFRYSYQDAANVKPDDVSVFTNDGPPTLVVQTCTGSWFELRRMYRFNFESVEG